jgi:hypothetical protein
VVDSLVLRALQLVQVELSGLLIEGVREAADGTDGWSRARAWVSVSRLLCFSPKRREIAQPVRAEEGKTLTSLQTLHP